MDRFVLPASNGNINMIGQDWREPTCFKSSSALG